MINIGYKNNKHITLNLEDLTKNLAIFGATGSGKTGAIIALAEQCVQNRIPIVLVDIKGDLVNLVSASRELKFHSYCFTPGSFVGDAISIISPLFAADKDKSDAIKMFLDFLGLDSNPLKSPFTCFLTLLLDQYKIYSLPILYDHILSPPHIELNARPLNEIISKTNRIKLAQHCQRLLTLPEFKPWLEGVDLNFDCLLKKYFEADTSPVVIYSVKHISDAQQQISSITFFLTSYRKWLLSQAGSSTVRSVLVIDECEGLAPPYPHNPSSKAELFKLVKQGRAFGGSVILATQNPKSIDSQLLTNCLTWLVGKLSTRNDQNRVLEGMLSLANSSKQALLHKLVSLDHREFLLKTEKTIFNIKTYDTYSALEGPCSVEQIISYKESGCIVPYNDVLNCLDFFEVWS